MYSITIKKRKAPDFYGPAMKIPMQETPVGSLVGELRFRKLQDTDKNENKKKGKKQKQKQKPYTWVVSENCAIDSRSFHNCLINF